MLHVKEGVFPAYAQPKGSCEVSLFVLPPSQSSLTQKPESLISDIDLISSTGGHHDTRYVGLL